MKKLLLFTFVLAISSQICVEAKNKKWQLKFPSKEQHQEFMETAKKTLIGEEPKFDFAVNMTFDKEEKKEGYTRYFVSYNVDKDERIKAYLLVPDHKENEKMPLVLALHPTFRAGKDIMTGEGTVPNASTDLKRRLKHRANALELVKRGYVCFVPDRGGYGERGDKNIPDVIRSMQNHQKNHKQKYPNWHERYGKVVKDLQFALDELVKLDYVDADNIGALGHSLGGWDSLYIWGLDDRVKAAAVNSGGAHWFIDAMWTNHKWRMAFIQGKAAVKPNTDSTAQIFMMMGAPKPLLYIRGLKEEGTDYSTSPVQKSRFIYEYYQSLGDHEYKVHGKNQFAGYYHSDGHDFPKPARDLAYGWLDVQLKGDTAE